MDNKKDKDSLKEEVRTDECECKEFDECECKECECEECKDCECDECERCKELEEELKKERESKLIVLADLVNYRKRMDKERDELSIIANKRILLHIIDVIDDIDRAKEDKKTKDEGFDMIYSKLISILKDYDLEKIECKVGSDFNPELMEAVTAIHTEEKDKKNKVVDIIGKGYKNNRSGNVFKSAKVIIGK